MVVARPAADELDDVLGSFAAKWKMEVCIGPEVCQFRVG